MKRRLGYWDYCDKCQDITFFELLEFTGPFSFRAKCEKCGYVKEFELYP